MSQIEIFFSYSHKDELFKDELEKQLSSLRWQGIVTNWTDRAIIPGQEWAGEISKHLATAQIILLLISPDFMASPYCYSVEMKRAVERHERGEAHVIPIILRSIRWQDAPFGKLQALPRDAKPVKSWPDQDEALYNVAEGIRKVVEKLRKKLSDVPAKATEQRTIPSIPLIQPLPETVSQTNQLIETSTNTASKIAPPIRQSLSNLEKVETSSPIELSSTQYTETFHLKHILTGHSKGVNSVAISPDGQTLVSGSDDKTIRVWNLHSGELLRTLRGHSGWVIRADGVMSVAISSDEQTLGSGGGDDKTVRVWNLHSGELLRTFKGHKDWVRSVAISPDGNTIISGSDDKTIKVWNLQTGALLHTLARHEGFVISVAISPDGNTIISGSRDKTVRVWSLHSGELLNTLTGHEGFVRVAISPDGQTLVSGGGSDKTVRVWDLHSGELLRTLGYSNGIMSVAISPDGHTLASGSRDETVVWNLRSGELLNTLAGHTNIINSVVISPDGRTIVSGSEDNTIRVWSK